MTEALGLVGGVAAVGRYGFIAQELEKVMPELVRDHKDCVEQTSLK